VSGAQAHGRSAGTAATTIAAMPGARESRSRPAVRRRWAGIVLRSLHLVAVSWLALTLFGGAPQPAGAALLLVVSGAVLLVLELADRRIRLAELAGMVVLAKLGLTAAMVVWPAAAAWLFWALVFVSSLASHAPREWRHWPTRL
jgi:hypothetical protein